jgi:hypothetical protein
MPQLNAGASFLHKNLVGIIILITFAAVFTNHNKIIIIVYEKSV